MSPREIVADMIRRYDHTYFWVRIPDSNDTTLCFCNKIEQIGDGGEIHLNSEEYGQLKLNINTQHDLLFHTPRVGVFQFKREAFVYRRRPARQYRRGLCSGNAVIGSVVGMALLGWGNTLTEDSTSLGLVQAAYDGETFSVETALEMLRKRKARSVALPNDFSISISLSNYTANYLVYYMDSVIAQIDQAGRVIQVFEKIYSEELKELFPS